MPAFQLAGRRSTASKACFLAAEGYKPVPVVSMRGFSLEPAHCYRNSISCDLRGANSQNRMLLPRASMLAVAPITF
jgi:hypothetical protein